MDARRHSFRLEASFDQRLSLVVLACVCLSSFLAWPELELFWYRLLQLLLFLATLIFFSYQLWSLGHWQRLLVLDDLGAASLGADEGCRLQGKPWVTPFACLIYLHTPSGKRLLIVWADMLDDADYRRLCRLLLGHRPD
ncbi:hypothetical protein LZP73_03755 [Shewanella sp. AS16]|uniref:protein YgfX n=1 Tax=Shewanella sp. AS16 TaxID=2907625 RepID=UPI001F2FE7E5|nr:protein YgfX [Shewanella sp. AS16]MCE9685330.1 hypothetical protein [Shewanella sp. AS16]